MGLLKHVVLPLYALLNVAVVFGSLVAEDLSDMLAAWGRDTARVPVTDLELHLYHAVGGTMAALLVNNVAAIVVDNAHYRGMACLLQMIFFAVDGYSYYRMGLPIPGVIYVIVGLGVVGLAVHAREPGIFTKDNTKPKSG